MAMVALHKNEVITGDLVASAKRGHGSHPSSYTCNPFEVVPANHPNVAIKSCIDINPC
jgi:hypothetical protein